MKYLLHFLLVILLFLSCTIIPPPPINNLEKPVFVARDYSLCEINEKYPEYHSKLLGVINLYESFKTALIDTLEEIDSILVEGASLDRDFFINSISNANIVGIGLYCIDIDSSYFIDSDTLRHKNPYFKIFNYPIPLLEFAIYEFKPRGPIENYFIINCYYSFAFINKHAYEVKGYILQLYTKHINNKLLINKIKIINEDEFGFKIPFFLRPLILFKK